MAAAVWLVAMTAASARAGVISPDLERAMAHRGTHADTAVIVRFADPQGYDTTVAVYNLNTTRQADPNMFRIDYTRNIQ